MRSSPRWLYLTPLNGVHQSSELAGRDSQVLSAQQGVDVELSRRVDHGPRRARRSLTRAIPCHAGPGEGCRGQIMSRRAALEVETAGGGDYSSHRKKITLPYHTM